MAIELGATRDAFIDAGASPEMASKAAQELAGYDGQLSRLTNEVSNLRAELRSDIGSLRAELRTENANMRAEFKLADADIRGDMKVLKWGQGITGAMVAAMFLRMFIH